jgi:hypothetical protein
MQSESGPSAMSTSAASTNGTSASVSGAVSAAVSATVPSKVFLLGEYTVLEGFPALVAAISPRQYFFSDRADVQQTPAQTAAQAAASTRPVTELAHPDSPLGRWVHSFQSELKFESITNAWY